jgi:hypothetical protein
MPFLIQSHPFEFSATRVASLVPRLSGLVATEDDEKRASFSSSSCLVVGFSFFPGCSLRHRTFEPERRV